MARLSNQTFSTDHARKTSQFYDELHIHYEKVGVFSENNPYVTTYGLLRDRMASTGLGDKVRDGVVLDAGCGAWQKGTRVLRQFSPRRIEAVDLNERSIAHCKTDPQHNTNYSVQDLARLNFADETFDVVVCEGVLHHTLDPATTLNELIRVLKVGGYLALGVYCWRFPYSFLSATLKNTVGRIVDPKTFLAMSGKNKLMLILADLIFVPIEHTIKEKEILNHLASKRCEVIFNDFMIWPLPLLGERSALVFKLTGFNYRHIFAAKKGPLDPGRA